MQQVAEALLSAWQAINAQISTLSRRLIVSVAAWPFFLADIWM